METQMFYWVKGVRMSEQQFNSLTLDDINKLKAFWAGTLTDEDKIAVVKKYNHNWPTNK